MMSPTRRLLNVASFSSNVLKQTTTAVSQIPTPVRTQVTTPVRPAFDTDLTCHGCGTTVSGVGAPVLKCPNAAAHPHVDHVLMPSTSIGVDQISKMVSKCDIRIDNTADVSPFVKYRVLMYPYRVAMSLGMSDAEYVDLVNKLDEGVAKFDGHGFRETPLHFDSGLNAFVKDESKNVAQSHKARYFFNVMTYLLVLDAKSPTSLKASKRLAVASCGNAGLAAATIAAAVNWPIDVCIPPEASPAIVEKLHKLGADIRVCGRDSKTVSTAFGDVSLEGAADPCVAAFRNLVKDHGSIPFSVQGTECGLAAEGGQTLAWEILEAAKRQGQELDFDRVFAQVGGGAMGAGLAQGFARVLSGEVGEVIEGLKMDKAPAFMYVQVEGNAPLHRAYDKMKKENCDPTLARSRKPEFMFPWENPHSIASGILDDETYDWAQLVDAMHEHGGDVVVINDDAVIKAKEVAKDTFNVNACHTGSSGLAGLMTHTSQCQPCTHGRPSIAILTGLDRSE